MAEYPESSPSPSPPSAHRRGRRLLSALAAAAAVTLTAAAPAALAHSRGCKHAHTRITAASRPQLRAAVVCLINQQRTERHLPKLAADGHLDHSAQVWTNDMVSHHNFSHGADFSARISAAGFDWSNVGENIAGGFATPTSVVRAWMASTGHCTNILSPVYRDVGTGVSGGSNGTWTQDFGLIMGQHPASGNYGPAQGCPYN
jgi:uncharacterized protein YkwD